MNRKKNHDRINRREKRIIKNMRNANRRKALLVLVLMLCLGLLGFISFRSNQHCSRVEMQISSMEKMHADKVSEYNALQAKVNQTKDSQVAVDELNKRMNLLIKENEALKENNREIIEDNISLQNSLKLAAMAGIKPRNYTDPPQITSRSGIGRGKYLGEFKGTAYTPSRKECGNDKGITYSGKPIVPGTTVAVDTRYWPIGTVFYIKGIGYVTAMDTGNKIKGKNRFDIAVFDRDFAKLLGSRYWDVYLVKMGNGKVEEITN